jgi:ribosomal protein S18 acetylase RimI-like enzyme
LARRRADPGETAVPAESALPNQRPHGVIGLRPIESADYDGLIDRIDDWWGGRPMRSMLPRVFFEHFRDTSFVALDQGSIVGFLVGLLAQSEPREAYIHFVGIEPGHRRAGLARQLYERFFDVARAHGRTTVRCVTSPVNRGSIAYHTAMGFSIEPGDGVVDGVAVHLDHDGPGEHRVRFVRQI